MNHDLAAWQDRAEDAAHENATHQHATYEKPETTASKLAAAEEEIARLRRELNAAGYLLRMFLSALTEEK